LLYETGIIQSYQTAPISFSLSYVILT